MSNDLGTTPRPPVPPPAPEHAPAPPRPGPAPETGRADDRWWSAPSAGSALGRSGQAATALLLVHAIAAPAIYASDLAAPVAVVAATSMAVLAAVAATLMARRDGALRRTLADRTDRLVRSQRRAAELRDELELLDRRAEQAAAVRERDAAQHQRDLTAIGRTLTHLVERQLPEVYVGEPPPPEPAAGAAPRAAAAIEQPVREILAMAKQERDRREGMRLVVVSLCRRVQAGIESVYGEASRLPYDYPGDSALFGRAMHVQHTTRQAARLVQNIVTLAGERPGQRWQRNQPLVDVVRAASGRIKPYKRVQVTGDVELGIIADLSEPMIHLVAELLANATQSSPPTSMVEAQVREVQRGALIVIDDTGLGLRDYEMEEFREIASGRNLQGLDTLFGIPQTGLAVVGRYAERHGFTVELDESPYGGLRVVIRIDKEMLCTVPLLPPHLRAATAPATSGRRNGGGRGQAASTAPDKTAPPSGAAAAPASAPERRADEPARSASSGKPLPQRRHRRDAPRIRPLADPTRPQGTAGRSPEAEGAWMAAFLATPAQCAPQPRGPQTSDPEPPTETRPAPDQEGQHDHG